MSSSRALGSYAPGRMSLHVSPCGLTSSGLRPAEESSPIAPLISLSTIQKSPISVDSTRGARSLNFCGTLRTHRSLGGFTCESAETIRLLMVLRPPGCAPLSTHRRSLVKQLIESGSLAAKTLDSAHDVARSPCASHPGQARLHHGGKRRTGDLRGA